MDAPQGFIRTGTEMSGSDSRYSAFSGEDQVFDAREEASCRYSKVPILGDRAFDKAAEAAWFTYPPGSNSTYAYNIQKVLKATIGGRWVCSYHLARAVATAQVEVQSGVPGRKYAELCPALNALMIALVDGNARSDWIENAQEWLDSFMIAAAHGSTAFKQFYVDTRKQVLAD
jgi:hypothetical protein